MFDGATTFGWFDIVSLFLTLIGLLAAGIQARSAKNAADAALEASANTEKELAKSQLLVGLSGIQQIISDIEASASNDEKSVTVFSLVRFGIAATEAKELLAQERGIDPSLATDLDILSKKALDLKAALAKSTSPKVARPSDALRSDLGLLNLKIQEATTRVRFRTEGGTDVQ